YFHQLKNEVLLGFAGSSDHNHLYETPDEYWKLTQSTVKRWNVPGEFVAILGYEWAKWRQNGDADRNVYYLEDDRPMYRSDNGHYASPPELFAVLEQEQEKAIVIPHHTAHSGNWCDWKDYSAKYGRLVEIFQVRGSYECAAEDGNPVPEDPTDPPAFPTGYVRDALALGWRVGFTAGGDDHRGHWGTEFRFGLSNRGYKQGLMYVEADERTRASIFQALYDRRVVATTGPRMLLSCRLNGHPIGSELSLAAHPVLAKTRALSIEFHGTAPLDRIDIIRNNEVVHSAPGEGGLDVSFSWDDTISIEDTWLPPAQHCDHSFTFYYVRAIQSDGEVAWASPVWIDP
ncbi:MAG: DUF3604 domain-containing protein, partial [bacterium]|nr:DUF3604 domain-containing protein [bacterium]